MLEALGLQDWTPQGASVVFGALLGVAFGVLAQRSGFCLRRGLVGPEPERKSALGVWATALAVAILACAALQWYGLISFEKHRFHANALPLTAIIIGGLMFGVGMTLARGCASRLTVLAGSGNLRAWVTIGVFAIVAHATLKGVLAPLRTWLSAPTVPLGSYASLGSLPGGVLLWSGLLAAALLAFAATSKARPLHLAMGAAIGALVAIGWLGTGYLLVDEFSPIPLESLAFTSSASETLLYVIAGTALKPTFGFGVFLGTLAGSLIAAVAAREFAWTGFTAETKVSRYLTGGALMGVGGVLAGGCTVGAGLSGVPTLGVSALLALAAIAAGALATDLASRRAVQRAVVVAAE